MSQAQVDSADLKKLLNLVATLYGAQDERDYAARAVRVLCELVPNELAAFNHIDTRRNFSQFVASNPTDPAFKNMEGFHLHIHEHPVIRHVARTGIYSPEQISDHSSLTDWSENPLHREFFVPGGHAEEDQISFILPGFDPKGIMCGFNMQRKWGAFTARDKELVTLLYPHLHQAFQSARRLTVLRDRALLCEGFLDRSTAALVRVAHDSSVLWMTAAAERLLAEASLACVGPHLPTALHRWLQPMLAIVASPASGDPPAQWEPLRLTTPRGILDARASAQSDGGLLLTLLASWTTTIPADAAPAPPLPKVTRRQEQVLELLAQGLSVKEVAAKLGITYYTAQEHVAALYAALGVNTRGQLVALYYKSRG